MLLDQIKADSLEARKANVREPGAHSLRVNLLATLYAEAAKVGKDASNRPSTDAEVLTVVRKFLKNLDEAIAVLEKAGKEAATQKQEKAILEGYLPRQLSHDELAAAVDALVAELPQPSPKAMGEVMKQLQTRYAGLYDGRAANEIVRERLQKGT